MNEIIACCTAVFCACTPASNIQFFPLIVNDHTTPIFEMRAGACLRGPLTIRGADGKTQFELADAVEYPTDCGKKGN